MPPAHSCVLKGMKKLFLDHVIKSTGFSNIYYDDDYDLLYYNKINIMKQIIE